MKTSRLGLIASLLVTFSLGSVARADFPDVCEPTLRATALVFNSRDQLTGAAVVVDTGHRLLVTAQHVIGSAGRVEIYFPASNQGRITRQPDRDLRTDGVVADVVAFDVGRDLAVLQAKTLPDGMQAVKIARGNPRRGDDVYFVGHPRDRGPWDHAYSKVVDGDRLAPGRVSFSQVHVVLVDASMSFGNSGGPVVNANGELVGIARGIDERPYGNCYAVHAREIRSLLGTLRYSRIFGLRNSTNQPIACEISWNRGETWQPNAIEPGDTKFPSDPDRSAAAKPMIRFEAHALESQGPQYELEFSVLLCGDNCRDVNGVPVYEFKRDDVERVAIYKARRHRVEDILTTPDSPAGGTFEGEISALGQRSTTTAKAAIEMFRP